MWVMGLGGSDHDTSACIVHDGLVTCAIEEERLTRKRHNLGGNLLLGVGRKYCYATVGHGADTMDYVVVDDTLADTARFGVRRHAVSINHHLAHAACAFYLSPFEKAAIVVMDNAGSVVEWNRRAGVETVSYAYGEGTSISMLQKVVADEYHKAAVLVGKRPYQYGEPNDSLGHFYKVISRACGFMSYSNGDFYFTEDGKTMALASYGTDALYNIIAPFVSLENDGQFRVDLRSGRLVRLLEDRVTAARSPDEQFRAKADIAWAGQRVLERAVQHCATYAAELTGCCNLCLAGGVALNCVANGRLIDGWGGRSLFVPPAAGDSGTALGAALFGYHSLGGRPREMVRGFHHAYLGRHYSAAESERALNKRSAVVGWEVVRDPAQTVAEMLASGSAVGWFEGGSEFGPRALGHRSILADPRDKGMRQHLNARVKRREWFRPFAPAVLGRAVAEYFEPTVDSPFMTVALPVVAAKREIVPAITHVDGTARVQTVEQDGSEFARLLGAFERRTGVPIVLNTSLNGPGEPIVETPDEALDCMLATGLDCLVLGQYIAWPKQAGLNGRVS